MMIACGAGAGLAAVYNVPLGGAIFTLEVLLNSFALSVAIPALTTAVIAAVVAWIGLGDRSQYLLPPMEISAPLVIYAIVMGPLFGYAGYWYARLAVAARKRAPRDWRLVPWCLASFASIGAAAIWYPELLGNGRGPMQLALDSSIPVTLAIALLVLKLAATTAVLRAGAEGGLLTPGLTIGALMATLLGAFWNGLGAGVSPGSFALIGATAFIASSLAMPVTAIALALEFTRVDHDFLIPILCAVAGSVAVRRLAGDV
jgi:H+/Cl- antiporter ClcA